MPKDIGNNTPANNNHPNVKKTHENKTATQQLEFNAISNEFVDKKLKELNIKKATGIDGISVKVLKLAQPVITKPITELINKTIKSATFPDKLKEAQVVPLHKKNNVLDVGNYRPVSILPAISNFFERAIYNQLVEYFNTHFHPYLSAFRPKYGCQTTLLRIIEDWKRHLIKISLLAQFYGSI